MAWVYSRIILILSNAILEFKSVITVDSGEGSCIRDQLPT